MARRRKIRIKGRRSLARALENLEQKVDPDTSEQKSEPAPPPPPSQDPRVQEQRPERKKPGPKQKDRP